MAKKKSSFFSQLKNKIGKKKKTQDEITEEIHYSASHDHNDSEVEQALLYDKSDQNDGPPEFIEEELDDSDEIQELRVDDDEKQQLDQLDSDFPNQFQNDVPPPFTPHTEDRPIDLEAIKNYQLTEEDEKAENEELQDLDQIKEVAIPKPSSLQKISSQLMRNFKLISLSLSARLKNTQNGTGKGLSLEKISAYLQWDQLIDGIFSTQKRPLIHSLFLISLVVSSSYWAGKTTAIILTGAPETSAPPGQVVRTIGERSNYSEQIATLRNTNLFNAKMTEQVITETEVEVTPVDLDIICETATKSSGLPITLINTVVLQDSVKSIASVQLRGSRELKNLREGEKINNMAEISRIQRQSIVLKNLETGECEYVAAAEEQRRRQTPARGRTQVVSPEQGAQLMQNIRDERIVNEGDSFAIEPSVRDEMLANINEVLTQARAVQIRNPDGSFSFRMTEIVPGSIYSQLGIQNDDIITGINGESISSINELMTLFGRIRDIDRFEIRVQRDGSERNFNYQFR